MSLPLTHELVPDKTVENTMTEAEQRVSINVTSSGIALSAMKDDAHLCAPLAEDDDDDDDDEPTDPQPYQYVSDSEKDDTDDLEEKDDWQVAPDETGDINFEAEAAPSITPSIVGADPTAIAAPEDFTDMPDDPPVLTKEEEIYADEIASLILKGQLVDAPWIKSDLPDADIVAIVQRTQRQNPAAYSYDYLPRVFHVSEEDFDLWLEKDGHDHFFEWNLEKHMKASTGPRASSPYLWTKYFLCHREGQPRVSKASTNKSAEELGNPEQPIKVKRPRTVYKPSCKTGCRAKLVVHKMMEDHLIARNRLRVSYYYRHTGHSLGDIHDFQHLRMTDDTRARIRNLVRLGLGTRAIRSRIHVQGERAGVLLGQGSLQRDHVLTYDDIYTVCHKYWAETVKLHSDDLTSMHAWMDRLKQQKQFTVFEWHGQPDRTRRVCKHMMTLSYAYGHDRSLILPSLQVLKLQSTRIAEASSSPFQLDDDPFEGRLEMNNEDENFVEIQAVKELLRRVLYTDEWTPQQTERVNALAQEIATTLHLENDTPLPRKTQPRY
ncbi:MAG: hypothetical protein J3R72DRAFT_476581 [Linnemannia gamsii]|nr:MAG: hypothetical protein J3R72DRAFT_476581 [Linnemannia gamsii]